MEYRRIEEIGYGELLPEVVLNPVTEVTTPENRERINAESVKAMRELHADIPIEIDTQDVVITRDGYHIPLRIYKPERENGAPVVIYYHGGGWVKCSIDTHDYICRYLAKNSGLVVVSVEYRLAPENKFPRGLEDCCEALLWVEENVADFGADPLKIIVAGDSSGGNLAAAVCLLNKERNGPKIAKQVLIYPVIDASNTSSGSYIRYENGYGLMRETMETFIEQYVNNDDEKYNPLVTPLFYGDVSGLPPALFIFAQCDVLLDEGLKYAKKLRDAGVGVEYHVYSGMPHGFIGYTYKQTFEALDQIVESLKEDRYE